MQQRCTLIVPSFAPLKACNDLGVHKTPQRAMISSSPAACGPCSSRMHSLAPTWSGEEGGVAESLVRNTLLCTYCKLVFIKQVGLCSIQQVPTMYLLSLLLHFCLHVSPTH